MRFVEHLVVHTLFVNRIFDHGAQNRRVPLHRARHYLLSTYRNEDV